MTSPFPGQMEATVSANDHERIGTRYPLLGTGVDALTISDLNHILRRAIASNSRCLVSHHNVHSLYLYPRNAAIRAIAERAEYIHIDGMPLVWMLQAMGHPVERDHRVTYVDWTGPLMREAVAQDWRIFYLGSKPEVLPRGLSVLREQYPGLTIEGHHGYFDMDPSGPENMAVREKINQYAPDILMVGMGMPRQEKWIQQNMDAVNATVFQNTGACLDYVAGATPTPPRWMGRAGLEWFYRLIQEPRRLGRRYLIEPWDVLFRFLRALAGQRHTG